MLLVGEEIQFGKGGQGNWQNFLGFQMSSFLGQPVISQMQNIHGYTWNHLETEMWAVAYFYKWGELVFVGFFSWHDKIYNLKLFVLGAIVLLLCSCFIITYSYSVGS